MSIVVQKETKWTDRFETELMIARGSRTKWTTWSIIKIIMTKIVVIVVIVIIVNIIIVIVINVIVMTDDSLVSAANKLSSSFSQVLLFWHKLSRRSFVSSSGAYLSVIIVIVIIKIAITMTTFLLVLWTQGSSPA